MNILKSIFRGRMRSRKLLVFAGVTVLTAVNAKLGWVIPEDAWNRVVDLAMVYLIGQGFADGAGPLVKAVANRVANRKHRPAAGGE